VGIDQVTIINTYSLTESEPFSIQEFVDKDKPREEGKNNANFDSFDHQYFHSEIAKLVKLREIIEQERFHSRRYIQ